MLFGLSFVTDVIVDALRDGGIVKVTEREAIEEGLLILRRPVLQSTFVPPSRSPVKSAEARHNTRHSTVKDYRANNVRGDLKENFHWEIARARRLKNLTRGQLANLLNVSEEQIIFIERGELPKDDYVLINKLERYLNIRLRKEAVVSQVPVRSPVTPGLGEPPEAPKPPRQSFDSQQSYPKDVTLAELQKRKEMAKKMEPGNSKNLFGNDIELIE